MAQANIDHGCVSSQKPTALVSFQFRYILWALITLAAGALAVSQLQAITLRCVTINLS